MPDSSIVSSEESFFEPDQPVADGQPGIATHLRRESVLLWCIGAAFGVAMLLLLFGMIAAEMSMHRASSVNPAVQSAGAPPTYSIVAAH